MNATFAISDFPPARGRGFRDAMLAMASGERGGGRRRHHRHGSRDVFFGGPPFGFGGPFGRGGPKARRGDVRTAEADGRKQYELTDAGNAYVAERDEELPPPWEEMSGGYSDDMKAAGNNMRDVALAFSQVMRAGSQTQIAEASKILADARRSLYRILADGEPAEGEDA